MISSIQMTFPSKGAAGLILKKWSYYAQRVLTITYEQIEKQRTWNYPASLKSRIIDWNEREEEGLIKDVLCWISPSSYYFFEFRFKNPESDKVKLHQFYWLTQLIAIRKTELTPQTLPVKLGLIWGASVTVSLEVAITVLAMTRCKKASFARILIDMIQDGEME